MSGTKNSYQKEILIVEDDSDLREILTLVLLNEGYTVNQAHSAKKMYYSLKSHLPDLIILDLNLPDTRGDQVITKLKQQKSTQKLPILLVSGDLELSDISERIGHKHYLHKPFDIDELLESIKNTVN